MEKGEYKEQLRVKGTTPPEQLASAIFAKLQQGVRLELCAVGAASVNQACKALARASGFVAQQGHELYVRVGLDVLRAPEGGELTVTYFIPKIL